MKCSNLKNCFKSMNLISKIFIIFMMMSLIFSFVSIFTDSFIPMIFTNVKVIKNDEFVKTMKEYNCDTVNLSKKSKIEGIKSYYKTSKECPYVVEYYTFKDKKNTKLYKYNLISESSKTIKDGDELLLTNYSEYEGENNSYIAIVQNKNSILYINTDIKNKDKAIDIRKKLGYDSRVFLDVDKTIAFIFITFLIIIFITIVSFWKIFVKLGRKGWISLIPFYNVICLSKDVFGNWKYSLLFFIPYTTIIYMVLLLVYLTRKFKKNDKFLLGLILLYPLFIMLLAFENSEYNKKDKVKNNVDIEKRCKKIFKRLFLIPAIIWNLISLISMFDEEEPLTLEEFILVDIFFILLWLVISYIIYLIIKFIYKKTTKK